MRRPAEAHRQNDRVASKTGDTRQVGDHEGLRAARVEERGKRRVVPDLGEHGLPDVVRVHRRGGDDRERLVRVGQRVRDHEVHDVVDLGTRAVDRTRHGVGHPGAGHQVKSYQGFGPRQRRRRQNTLVAVIREERGEVRVSARRVGAQRDARQHGGKLADGRTRRAARVPDDDDLPATGDRRERDLERKVLDRVQHHDVDRAVRGEDLWHEHRCRHEHRAEAPHQVWVARHGLTQTGQTFLDELGEQCLRLLAMVPESQRDLRDDRVPDGGRETGDVCPIELLVLGRESAEGVAVIPRESRVRREYLLEDAAPPGELELDADHRHLDMAPTEVVEEVAEPGGPQRVHERGALRQGRQSDAIRVQPPQPVEQRVERELLEVRPLRSRSQHGFEGVERGDHVAALRLDRGEPLRQPGPPTCRAVRLPHAALRLDLDESRVQVDDRTTGPHHVLRLTAQAPSHHTTHLDAVRLPPCLRGGRSDEVGRRPLEDHGLERVERTTDAREHAQLLRPGVHRRRDRQPGGLGDVRDPGRQRRQAGGHECLDLRQRPRGVDIGAQVRAVPRGVPGPDGERTESGGSGEVAGESLAALAIHHPCDVGCEPHGGAGGRARRRELGECLQRVVCGRAPWEALEVQCAHIAPELLPACDEVAPQGRGGPGVDGGRLQRHRTEEPARRGRAPAGVRSDVEHEVVQAELLHAARDGGCRTTMTRDVEHAPAVRGRIGHHGCDGARDVAAGRGVDEQVRTGGQDVEDVLLRGVEVADPALGVGVPIPTDALGQRGLQRHLALVVAGESSDDLVTIEGAGKLVEIVDEHLTRVHEGPDHEPFDELEVLEDRLAQGVEPIERGPGIETRPCERTARERGRVEQGAAAPQGTRQHGVDLERRLEAQLVVASTAATREQRDGPQEHGCADRPDRQRRRRTLRNLLLRRDRGELGGDRGSATLARDRLIRRRGRRRRLPCHRRERGDVIGTVLTGVALDPGGDADREVGGGDPVPLGVLLGARSDGTRAALRGRERGALPNEVGQSRLPAGEELGDARGVRRGQIQSGLAEEVHVAQGRAAGRLHEGRAPACDGPVHDVDRRRGDDDHGRRDGSTVRGHGRAPVGSRTWGAGGDDHAWHASRDRARRSRWHADTPGFLRVCQVIPGPGASGQPGQTWRQCAPRRGQAMRTVRYECDCSARCWSNVQAEPFG